QGRAGQSDNGAASLAARCSAHEIDQTTSPGHLARPQALRVDLPSQIDLHSSIDRNHVVNHTNTIGVVRILDGVKFDQVITVDEVIQPLCAATETGHHFARIKRFALSIDTAAL